MAALQAEVDGALSAPRPEYADDGSSAKRLTASPKVNERVLALAGKYLLTGDRNAAARARDEMLTAAAFPDWHPPHFLDSAVMAHALGVGYDWLYPYLTPEERRTIREAIVEKAFKPALAAYQGRAWWTTTLHNWAFVTAGGLGVAALAIEDEAPEIAAEILDHAARSTRQALATYAPDGDWPEGPAYWAYGTSYWVGFAAALFTATGTDGGLSDAPGLAETGRFRLEMVGPTGKAFNFSDAGEDPGSAEIMLWLARRYGHPEYASGEAAVRSLARIRALLWYEPGCLAGPRPALEASVAYPREGLAILRAPGGGRPDAALAIKGGDNRAPHGHLDLGSFILDMGGVRWAVDLGSDRYQVPGYFDPKLRPSVYRVSTEAHNTLTLSDRVQAPLAFPNQVLTATAALLSFGTNRSGGRAVLDLTAAYAPYVRRVIRTVALLDAGRAVLEDAITALAPVDVVWSLHTRAAVEVTAPNHAVLSSAGERLALDLVGPAGARFEVAPCDPAARRKDSVEDRNAGVRNLTVRLAAPVTEARIQVRMALRPAAACRNPDCGPSAEPRTALRDELARALEITRERKSHVETLRRVTRMLVVDEVAPDNRRGARYEAYFDKTALKKQHYVRVPLLPRIPDRKQPKTAYSFKIERLLERAAEAPDDPEVAAIAGRFFRAAREALLADHKFAARSRLLAANAAVLACVHQHTVRERLFESAGSRRDDPGDEPAQPNQRDRGAQSPHAVAPERGPPPQRHEQGKDRGEQRDLSQLDA